MATNLAKLVVQLEAQTAQYMAKLDEANRRTTKFHGQVKGSIDSLVGAFKLLGGAYAAIRVVDFVKGQIDAADATSKLAQKAGIAIETLQGLSLGAKLAGSDTAGLESGLLRLGRSMSDAAQGLQTQKRAFDYLHVSVQNTDGTLRTTESVLRDVADRFAAMPDSAVKAAKAQEIFGQSGAQLIPLLNDGAKGIDELIDRATKLGIVWTGDAAKAAENFNDNLTLLKAASDGIATAIAQALLPAMSDLTDQMVAYAIKGEGAKQLTDDLVAATKFLAEGAIRAGYEMLILGDRVGGLAAGLKLLATDGWDAFKQTMDDVVERTIKTRQEMEATINKLYEQSKKGASALNDLGQGGKNAAAGVDAINDATGQNKIKQMIDALREQAATFGLSERAVALYKASVLGADGAQKQLIDSLYATLRAVKDQADQAPKGFSLLGFAANGGSLGGGVVRAGGKDLELSSTQQANDAIAESEQELTRIIEENERRRIKAREDAVSRLFDASYREIDLLRDHARRQQEIFREQVYAVTSLTGAFEALFAANADRSKRDFELHKKIALATAIIDTAAAVVASLRETPGPVWVKIAAAASAAAYGAARIQQIRSTSWQGGGGATASSAAATTTASSSQNATNGSATTQSRPGATTIYIGNLVGWDRYVRDQLIDVIREATDRHDVILFGPDSAQAHVLGG